MPEDESPTRIPILETARLEIRPFAADDLDAIHRILDVELAEVDFGNAGTKSRDERERWLCWTVLNETQLALLYQPPYGDRAIVCKETRELIGSAGLVP